MKRTTGARFPRPAGRCGTLAALVCCLARDPSALLTAAGAAGEDATPFRAGAASVDITPERLPVVVSGGFLEARADRVEDPLHARALVLDDGRIRLGIAVVDTLMMPGELVDEVRSLASAVTGIPPGNLVLSATHTHSAPSLMGALGTGVDEEYRRGIAPRIATALEEAARNLAPARIGWAVARDPAHTHCRRWVLRSDRARVDPFGKPTVRATMHPGYRNPDFVGPAGPVDDDVTVLGVRAPDGRPVAILANYSQHYAGAPPVSADYFGVFSERVRELLGADGSFVGILSQGTAGDLHWMDYSRDEKPGVDRFSVADGVARAALDAWRRIEFRDRVSLSARSSSLDLGVRAPDAGLLAWARGIVEAMGERSPRSIEEVYAREQLFLAESPRREVRLTALSVGDLGIAAIPAEVFGITGLKIKARSPLEPTFTMELANGAVGYIPPPEQHALGGYTTWPARSACLETAAEPRIVDAVLTLLEEVSGRPRREPGPARVPYSESVLSSMPLLYWRLGDMDGRRAADASGNARDGSMEGGVALFLEGPELPGFAGEWRGNRCLGTAGGWVRGGVPLSAPAFTVELWLWNGFPPDARPVAGTVISFRVEGGAEETLDLCGAEPAGAAGRLAFRSGSAAQLLGTTEIPMRNWRHVAVVREGEDVAVWLDGRREISGRVPALSAASGPRRLQILVGGREDGRSGLEGRIDEVAAFDRALPAEEMGRQLAASR